MLTYWFLGAAAIGAAAMAIHGRILLNREREHNGKFERALELRLQDNMELADAIAKHEHLLASGHKNLKIKTSRFGVDVIGQCERDPNLYFVVKSFQCEPNDQDEVEFAIRRAKELIETIQTI